MMNWLMKSEPDAYSIQKLQKEKKTWWTGVRNYQARNYMMKDMKVGETVLFYHSNAEPPGIAGLAKVSRLAEPDPTQFDKKSDVFEARASKAKPMWFCVEVEFVAIFPRFISLQDLRDEKKLTTMQVLKKGQRLSIQPVTDRELSVVKKMGGL
ncbi:MAG: EVE domain-containing protein [Bdellovibrio sp. CG10_big_fil_rev_8_21_14_0_10_47_8]|nr:MAG: EVE domain-containing protein [Bdellovibrio sp. CG10_big_fil_rev_8_21_14_0_10_47_8]